MLVAAHCVCVPLTLLYKLQPMRRETSSHELAGPRKKTADSQARGMDSTSTTVPPVYGLSTGTRQNNKQGPQAMSLRPAAQEVPPSPDNSDTSEIFSEEPMDSAQEREVFSFDGAAAGAVEIYDSFIGPVLCQSRDRSWRRL